MAARHAQRANTDPRNLSPKAKYAGIAGIAATGGMTVIAAFLAAIPGEALAGLGVWAVPVGAAIATAAAFLGAYAKHDPARDPSLTLDKAGQVYASAADAEGETERYVSGHYSNNRLAPDEAVTDVPVRPDPVELEAQELAEADKTEAREAADSNAVVSELERELQDQDKSDRP